MTQFIRFYKPRIFYDTRLREQLFKQPVMVCLYCLKFFENCNKQDVDMKVHTNSVVVLHVLHYKCPYGNSKLCNNTIASLF